MNGPDVHDRSLARALKILVLHLAEGESDADLPIYGAINLFWRRCTRRLLTAAGQLIELPQAFK